MENRWRIEAGAFPLPVVLIQHIQSFLDGKKAAQTSVLSKSWYSAWSTRPNLDFDERHFRNQNSEGGFWEFAKKTMQRYEALNLRIQSFRLVGVFWPSSDFCLAKELIVKALRMGVVDFRFYTSCETFTLPHEVLESETLNRLSVYGCKIDIRPDGKGCCGKLKSLSLNQVELNDDVICGLVSSCPLIEKLTLIKAGELCNVESRNLYELYKLKSLYLGNVEVDTLFFDNLSANFPCLKDLTLENCKVSSRSLECISFAQRNRVFSIPKLSLYFITTSREWESHIFVGCYDFSNAWFRKLKKLLPYLNFSKISLDITNLCVNKISPNYQPLPKAAVENVTMYVVLPSACFTVLECLICSCRPKSITLHLYLECGLPSHTHLEKVKYDFLAILLQRNVMGAREYCLMMNHELEEVDVEFFGEIVAETLPKKIHFRLGWRGGRG